MNFLFISAAVFLQLGSAQLTCPFPLSSVASCGIPCLSSRASVVGCTLDDLGCVCDSSRSSRMFTEIGNCFYASCTFDDAYSIYSEYDQVCRCLTQDVSQPASTAAGSTPINTSGGGGGGLGTFPTATDVAGGINGDDFEGSSGSDSSRSSSRSSSAAKIGIAVGVSVGVSALGFLIGFLVRMARKKRAAAKAAPNPFGVETSPQGAYPVPTAGYQGGYPAQNIGQQNYMQSPQSEYPQSQYPQAQYPQNQYPQNQYPQNQYPQNQYPQHPNPVETAQIR